MGIRLPEEFRGAWSPELDERFNAGPAPLKRVLGLTTSRLEMSEVRLTLAEAQALRTALSALVLKARTGELGIMHGADRFVSTQRIFKKADRDALQAAAQKLGLRSLPEFGG